MANVAIFKAGKTPEYLQSVNTPEYSGDPDVIVNPDLSQLVNVPIKYWKRSGETIVEMNTTEQEAIDAQDLLKRKNNADSFSVSVQNVLTALIKVINIRLPQGQKITKQELINAVKEEIL